MTDFSDSDKMLDYKNKNKNHKPIKYFQIKRVRNIKFLSFIHLITKNRNEVSKFLTYSQHELFTGSGFSVAIHILLCTYNICFIFIYIIIIHTTRANYCNFSLYFQILPFKTVDQFPVRATAAVLVSLVRVYFRDIIHTHLLPLMR